MEYNAFKDGKDKAAPLPGFGAGLGWGVKLAFMHSGGHDFAGLEGELEALRIRLSVGYFVSVGPGHGSNRWTADLGVGF